MIWIALIVCLAAVVVRDFHLRNLQAAGNEGYRAGFQQGMMQGKASCPLPRA